MFGSEEFVAKIYLKSTYLYAKFWREFFLGNRIFGGNKIFVGKNIFGDWRAVCLAVKSLWPASEYKHFGPCSMRMRMMRMMMRSSTKRRMIMMMMRMRMVMRRMMKSLWPASEYKHFVAPDAM